MINTFNAVHTKINASIGHFKLADAYCLLHTHLMHQSIQHVRDDNAMVNARELLYFQLQAEGHLSSPLTLEPPLMNLMDCFNCTPFQWWVDADKSFIYDGGDDDRYY